MGRGEVSRKMRQRKSLKKYKARQKRQSEQRHGQRTGDTSYGSDRLAAASQRAAPQRQHLMSLMEYNSLPRAADSDGECCDRACGTYPNRANEIILASGQKVFLVICRSCKKKMRPR